MIDFFMLHAGTVIISLILLLIIAAIFMKIKRDKRQGKCAGCDNCTGKKCPTAYH